MEIAHLLGLPVLSFVALYLFLFFIFRFLGCTPLTANWVIIGISIALFSYISVVLSHSDIDSLPITQFIKDMSGKEYLLLIGKIVLSLPVFYLFFYLSFRLVGCKIQTAKWNTIGLLIAYYCVAIVLLALSGFDQSPVNLSNYSSLESSAKVVLLGMVVGINLVVMPFLYGLDKSKASKEEEVRIPESVLHFFAFTGGAIGAMVSQRVFNHKTTKQPFRRVFWLSFVSSVMIYVLILYASGVLRLPFRFD
jgi:uncharacterized membrane protein YsdA (DUF1294 family)